MGRVSFTGFRFVQSYRGSRRLSSRRCDVRWRLGMAAHRSNCRDRGTVLSPITARFDTPILSHGTPCVLRRAGQSLALMHIHALGRILGSQACFGPDPPTGAIAIARQPCCEVAACIAQALEILKLEHQPMRAELLWRPGCINDVQNGALPLIVAPIAALSCGRAGRASYRRCRSCVGLAADPDVLALAITKIKHHRQRNREYPTYIMLVEMIMYGILTLSATGMPGIRDIESARIATANASTHRVTAADVGWEHFIRTYRHLLPRIVDRLEEENVGYRRPGQRMQESGSSRQ